MFRKDIAMTLTRRRSLAMLTSALAAPALAQQRPPRVETVAGRLANPWSLAFLPDRRMLVTERGGALRLLGADGRSLATIAGTPQVWARGQGGLLDVAPAPDFASSRVLYLSYAEPREDGAATSVMRARLSADSTALGDRQNIFRQLPASGGGTHFGSRIVPARDGTLFVTLGERGQKEKSQDLKTHYGKVVRINPDGSVPRDNPFVGRGDALPEIWSYGHRNVQGAALHPATGQLWTVEHGARGGDEVNRPEAGKNYGWPVITYGRDYSGLKIGEGTAKPGMEQPKHYWDPSIAPSGMTFYTGDVFPEWKGSMFVGALAGSLVSRLVFEGDRMVREERLLTDTGRRFRDIRQGPDGAIYCLTDEADGQLLRLAR